MYSTYRANRGQRNIRHVTESVGCPFHYTEGCKPFRNCRKCSLMPAQHGDELLSLAWNGQVDSYRHRKDCSAWPGWKPRKVLGPLTRFTTNIRHLSTTMYITWWGIANRLTTRPKIPF